MRLARARFLAIEDGLLMKFCYYCGKELEDADAFCRACGERVVSAETAESKSQRPVEVDLPEEGGSASASSKERSAKKPNGPRKVTIDVSGDIRWNLFASSRNLAFVTKKGKLLYTARGVRGVGREDAFADGPAESTYEIYDSQENVVRQVVFEEDFECVTFRRELPPPPPKPPAKGILQAIARAMESEPPKYEDKRFSGDPTLGEMLANRYVKTVGSYTAESEGKPFSFIPKRTDVLFKGNKVASIEPHEGSYRIKCEERKHALTSVMIFLALYARL